MQRRIPEDTQTYRDVRYGPHETRNVYDLYVPKQKGEAKDAKPLPLVIWIHGGGWQNGAKGAGGPATALLEQGFAVAAINYRLSGDAIFPAQIHDCKAAVRHLRAKSKEYGIDPERFGVWGSSAGGHLVALVGTSGDVKELEGDVGDFTSVSSRVQAVCDWFGPTDLAKMGGRHNDAESPESKLLGGAVQENLDRVARANPITYVSADDPAFLIQHGDKDPVVPYSQSELLRDALEEAKVPVTLVCIEGAGHGGAEFNEPETQRQVLEFFQKQLGGKND
ncbi:MAG: lipase [Pirellula sp.]|nr:lipase [Pirellula sp.]